MKSKYQPNLFAAALTCALASVVTAHADDTNVTVSATTSTNSSPSAVEMTPSDSDGWKFGVTVPLWAPQINGDATIRGHQADVNVNFSELRNHLDASFALAASAQNDKFGVFGNVGYMKFDGSHEDRIGGHTDAMLKFMIVNGGLSYQLLKTESEHPFILAGTAGVRFWYTSFDLDHRDFNGKRDFHGYTNFDVYDPVLGLRATQYFTKKLHLDVAGDGGGFNLNYDTDWTWSLSGMLTYDFTKWLSASAGYQAVALDESNGSGNSKKGVNLIFSGVAGAVTFKF
jgi:hypothetical protein